MKNKTKKNINNNINSKYLDAYLHNKNKKETEKKNIHKKRAKTTK